MEHGVFSTGPQVYLCCGDKHIAIGPKSLTLSHTLCDLTSQLTQREGLGLGGSVHEEARPCFPCFIQPTFK